MPPAVSQRFLANFNRTGTFLGVSIAFSNNVEREGDRNGFRRSEERSTRFMLQSADDSVSFGVRFN